jgi:Zn-dependent M28 family amino/carboxypeptidase
VFSGAAALARVHALMQWPRALGDPRRTTSIAALARELAAVADEVVQVPHDAPGPDGTSSWALVELVAHVRPQAARRFVLASHFDTRPWADEEADPELRDRPVPGANDGTSGVAVVLELVPLFARALPEDVGFSIVLFDGEELGRPGQGGYCMGSRHLADAIANGEHPLLARAEFGIVLDMVGDAELRVPIEPASLRNAPALVEHVWATAEELGVAQFERTPRERAILDDHKFLTAAGIPSILLIDRDYAAWHTTRDTVERVSAESLAAVGEVVRVAVLRWFSLPVADSRP